MKTTTLLVAAIAALAIPAFAQTTGGSEYSGTREMAQPDKTKKTAEQKAAADAKKKEAREAAKKSGPTGGSEYSGTREMAQPDYVKKTTEDKAAAAKKKKEERATWSKEEAEKQMKKNPGG